MELKNLFLLEAKKKDLSLSERKDPKRLFISPTHQYYYLNKRYIGGSSLAAIIENFGDLPKKFTNNLYSKSRKELGNEFHELIEDSIAKKQKNDNWNWDLDLFKYYGTLELYFDYFYDEIFHQLDHKNIITEYSFVGIIKNKKRGIRVAGTFDAFDYKNKILYEWKTANDINEDKWKIQCMIYALILKKNGYQINKIIIYYVRSLKWRKHEGEIQFDGNSIDSYIYEFDLKEIKKNWTEICKKLLKDYWNDLPKNIKFEIK